MLVTLATYNVHRCIGMDGRRAPERVIELLKSVDADVIALQEVESPGAKGLDFLGELSEKTGLTAIAGPTLLRGSHHYGNAMLTRAKILAVRRFGLAHAGREPRGALDVDLRIGDLEFQVVATHLGLRPWERRKQISRLLKMFRHGELRPTALLGDMNEWLPWGRPLRWLHNYFGKQPAPATFPSRFPLFALDRVWVHPASAVRSIEVPSVPYQRVASDHLPVKAVVEW